MRVVHLSEFGNLENFEMSALFAMEQHWKDGQTFAMREPRKQSAFLWFCGAEGQFILKNGKTLVVERGALVSIPQGAEYTITFYACEKPATILLEYCLAADKEPFVLSEEIEIVESDIKDHRMTDLIKSLAMEYAMPSRPYLSLRSGYYRFFYLLWQKEKRVSIGKGGFRSIEKGIRYLETDMEQRLTVEEIAKMCFVSPAYFRRLFHEYAGISPAAYRTKRKIERAKELMDRSDISVAELSELLGYDTPSYFCRVFKKETGVSPSQYKKSLTYTEKFGIEK